MDTRKSANSSTFHNRITKESAKPTSGYGCLYQILYRRRKRPDFEAQWQKNPRQVEDLVNAMMDTSGEVYGDDVIRRAVGDPFFARLIG